jgi:hypothetical protein
MPELPFVQVMAVAALGAILAVVLAMPLGAWVGPRAGRMLLRVSLIGVVGVFAGSLVWGSSAGDLGRFNAQMGVEAWFQMGLFFFVVYGTGYRFVSAYLTDKRRERTKEAADA